MCLYEIIIHSRSSSFLNLLQFFLFFPSIFFVLQKETNPFYSVDKNIYSLLIITCIYQWKNDDDDDEERPILVFSLIFFCFVIIQQAKLSL